MSYDVVETWKEELSRLIDKAERDGQWLRCSYQDLVFTPQELRDENAKGRFVWGVCNWQLIDPRERLNAELKKAEAAASNAAEIRKKLAALEGAAP